MATVQARRGFIEGVGLSPFTLAAVTAVSILLFLFWGGPLWAAPHHSSHLGRFAASYLVVVPTVLFLQHIRGLHSWRAALTALGVIWAVKLVATVVLYEGIAVGSRAQRVTAATSRSVAHRLTDSDGLAVGVTSWYGRVHRDGLPVEGAVVLAPELGCSTRTDAHGAFALPLRCGAATKLAVIATRPAGALRVEVTVSDPARAVDVSLDARAPLAF